MEAQVPEEVLRVVFREEVLLEVAGEVGKLVSPKVHSLLLRVPRHALLDRPVEKQEVGVVLVDDLVQDLGVLLSKHALLELGVGDCLAFQCVVIFRVGAVQAIRVLDDNVQPEAWLDLL